LASRESNLFAAFQAAFPEDRSRTCLIAEGGRAFSYGDLETASARYAALLRLHGVAPGDRVTAQIDKSPDALFLYLACLRVGAIFMPLNSLYTEAELDYFLSDAEPRLVVGTPKACSWLRPLLADRAILLSLDAEGAGSLAEQATALAPDPILAATSDADVAAMVYTSGTTGRSKGAMLTHRNLIANARTLTKLWGFSDRDVLLHCLPIFHVHGLFVALGCALLSQARILFHAGFDAERALAAMAEATVFMGVPTYYTRLLALPGLSVARMAPMRLFISGSAPLLPETFTAFRQRTGHVILERYGMTETGMNCSNPLDGERRMGTVGLPLPGVELRIADELGGKLPAGTVGIVEVRGDNVLKGYWRNPLKTRDSFRDDGFFITGDVARQDADGYVTIVGRASDMIISGGYNVYPKEVETLLDSLPGIVESAVIGVPHPDFGEAVVAVIRRQSGQQPLPEADLIACLRQKLAAFKLPKKLVFVEDLPRNAMGKVLKAELRRTHAGLFQP